MYYRIDAVDTWLFRDAAPFDAGMNHVAHSLFPPLPSVYAGVLNAAALRPTCGIDSGDADRVKSVGRRMRLGWNGVTVDGRFLFPMPLDGYIEPNEGLLERELVYAGDSSSLLPFSLACHPVSGKKETVLPDGGYLYDSNLSVYISGSERPVPYVPLRDYFRREVQLGICIDRQSGVAENHKLYQKEMIRPENCKERRCSLAVEATGVEIPDGVVVKVGGEGKTGDIHCMDTVLDIPPAPELFKEKYFKLYFATPAIFAKGWLPSWINEKDLRGSFAFKGRHVCVRLLGAAVGRPVAVGGFGYEKASIGEKKGYPRKMRYAVPAGSVYFFELLDGRPEDVERLFHKKCLSEYREGFDFEYNNWNRMRYCDRGFGYCLVGKISEKQGGILNV